MTKTHSNPHRKPRSKRRVLLFAVAAVALLSGAWALSARGGKGAAGVEAAQTPNNMHFTGKRAETEQFLEWNRTIPLTPAQVQTRKAALEALPAPCCSQNSADTCCCECNMKRATHGLAKFLIAKKGLNADAVRLAVLDWQRVTHPNGARGDACYTGRCNLPFSEDGCGGMTEGRLAF